MVSGPSALPPRVAAYRARYREEQLSAGYRGWLHFSFTSAVSLAVIALALSRLSSVSWRELLAVPLTFLFANLVEYLGHKGPMHHKARGRLGVLFVRHAQQHHHYYTHDAMAADDARDFHMVLFPPALLFFFLGVIATPLGALLFVLATPNLAWLYVATAMGYFLCYEWLHWSYHQPASSLVGRLGVVRALRAHHQTHHDLSLMARYNFNITFPLCDRLFGTSHRNGPERAP